jgi:hypothetical protein
MKNTLVLIAFLWSGIVWAGPIVGGDPFSGSADKGGFNVTIIDTDIDNAWELITGDGKAFTQLTASSRVISGSNMATYNILTITGLDSTTRSYRSDTLTVKTGIRDTSEVSFYAIEAAYLDSEITSTKVCSLMTFGGSLMNTIGAGGRNRVHASPVQRFFDSNDRPGITTVRAWINGSTAIEWEVRVYESPTFIRDAADSYTVAGVLYCNSSDPVDEIELDNKKLTPDSIVQIWGLGASANASGGVTLIGKRNAK